MKTINYNGKMITVTNKQAEVLQRRMLRVETQVRQVVASHVKDAIGDTVIASNAVGRVSVMRVALDTVRTTAAVSRVALRVANACNDKAVKLAEDILSRSKNAISSLA